jgi:hypothetical protein
VVEYTHYGDDHPAPDALPQGGGVASRLPDIPLFFLSIPTR